MKVNSTIANGSSFTMTINGTEVKATTTAAINEGDTLKSAATQLQTDIQTAVGKYNAAMGTNLTATDFTVTANKDGSLSVEYSGDEEITFSFGEYTDSTTGTTGTTASKLGLTNKTSGSSTSNKGITLQIGANEGQTMNFTLDEMSADALGVAGKNVDLSTQDSAQKATTAIDAAIKKVSARGQMGAVQNRLEHTINNLDTASENLQTAESRIRDTDMAEEMVNYSKNSILAQAGQSMLAQANQANQGVLTLLQ